jgi:hypothetical protein
MSDGIDWASSVYAVPDGTRNSLFSISRHSRAGLQIVPSPFDKLRAGSTGLAQPGWTSCHSTARGISSAAGLNFIV